MNNKKRKTEVKSEFAEDLLELTNEEESNQNLEFSKVNTNLTLPVFEDKNDQDNWEDFAKLPLKTKLNPFLKESLVVSKGSSSSSNFKIPTNESPAKNLKRTDVFSGSADGADSTTKDQKYIQNDNQVSIGGLNSILNEDIKHADQRSSGQSENIRPVGNHNVIQTKSKNADFPKNTISPKNIENRENLLLKEKLPISSVETVAITMLHKAMDENKEQDVYQPIVKNLGASQKNTDVEKKLVDPLQNQMSSLQSKISSSPSENNNNNEFKLGQVEQIRIAQNRISFLEKEIETLRWDNEKLGAAAQLLQKKSEDLVTQKQKIENRFENFESKSAEENKILKSKIEKKREENKDLRIKLEDLESRLGQDVKRSGGRERELENRLELIKMEKISLVASKDEIILNLKRQIDQLQFEVESYRKKTSELQKAIDINDEQIRRTVRTLRLALTNLEVSDESKLSNKSE
jgi:hypothetical protein